MTDQQQTILIAASGAVPALIVMAYFDWLDRKRPEPRSLRRKAAFFGMLSVIPVLLIDGGLMKAFAGKAEAAGPYHVALFQAFIVAAMVEEFCKIGVVYWSVWNKKEFDERMDGIVYAARAGLGFALVENILYMSQQGDLKAAAFVWTLRALLAVPGHAVWTGIMGYLVARRRFDKRGPGFLGGYLIAVFLHGAYDVSIFLQVPLRADGMDALAGGLLLVPLVVTFIGWRTIRRMARTALKLDDASEAASGHTATKSAT
ncbi:MAG: PrsW family intramembrane metalloprotease [Kofleriaceae bacterium]|nr:PrsW family intramembrane metalloprotease [Myxococcales bacterium]MCB9559979.1 PrsW family intramembrane metalloprotease [Kofleriaceae bacterium]MCB9575162.1 PrsW family intramembrane metalloprotease [Kofleriaceae bacterium]